MLFLASVAGVFLVIFLLILVNLIDYTILTVHYSSITTNGNHLNAVSSVAARI